MADEKDFGKGLHWDVHGPWKGPGANREEWAKYWAGDDSLFRSETGAPGTMENPLWRRVSWWLEWSDFTKEKGREPATLEEYVAWSQERQAVALGLAVRASKARFPGMGGIILWMGHDCFPCMANTAIVDFHGEPKPAGRAVGEIWNTLVEKLRAG